MSAEVEQAPAVEVVKNELPGKELTVDLLAPSLANIHRTLNGSGYAFTKLVLNKQNIKDIAILKNYPFIRHLDLSNNSIESISGLENAETLITLILSNNKISEVPAYLNDRKYLQIADFSHNEISKFELVKCPLLTYLNVSYNKIEELHFESFPNLTQLEARNNALKSTSGIAAPCLIKLYVSENHISTIKDLSLFPKLTHFYARNNRIMNLDGIQEGESLAYINLRQNQIARFAELEKLAGLKDLKAVVLRENPIASEEIYRQETLFRLPKLEKLDKDPILDEDREELEAYKANRKGDPTAVVNESSNSDPNEPSTISDVQPDESKPEETIES